MREQSLDRRTLLKATGTGVLALGASQFALGSGFGQESVTEITDWHDLDAVRENLDGSYVLQADIDSESDGYEEHVLNPSGGWNPIGDVDSPFTGSFNGDGHEIAGLSLARPNQDRAGLFAANEGEIVNSHLTSVEVTGGRSVGALAGRNAGEVTESSASGVVAGDSSTGILVGRNVSEVTESSASGEVSGTEGVGGLVGFSSGEVRESSATTVVTGEQNTGGLVGRNVGSVETSWTAGDVAGDGSRIGGLVGMNSGNTSEVSDSSASGDVTGGDEVGGLVGRNVGEVADSSASGEVVGEGSRVGGLVGQSAGAVIQSSASGDVTGESAVGGLVGRDGSLFSGGDVRAASASGDVTGDSSVGGLVGWNETGEVLEAFATGAVDGGSAVGGVVGENDGAVRDTYWDVETTGQQDGIGSGDDGEATGLGTDEMQGDAAVENMAALDFDENWQVLTDPPWYPVLSTVTVPGSVTSEGDPVANITVEFRDSVAVGTATTEDDGTFEGNIPPGHYEMVVEAEEFEPFEERVTIQQGRLQTFDIELDARPDEDEDTDDAEDADDADDDGPGFGVGGAIAGLGGASYLLKRRLGDDTE